SFTRRALTIRVSVIWVPGSGRGHGIVAPGVERMAAANAPQRQPAALERAETRNRGHRVLRAGRHETAARAQQGAEPALVAAQEGNEQACDHDNWTARRAHSCKGAGMVPAGYNSALSRLKGRRGTKHRGFEENPEEGGQGCLQEDPRQGSREEGGEEGRCREGRGEEGAGEEGGGEEGGREEGAGQEDAGQEGRRQEGRGEEGRAGEEGRGEEGAGEEGCGEEGRREENPGQEGRREEGRAREGGAGQEGGGREEGRPG